MTNAAGHEQALILAETALTAAQQALQQHEVAERAAGESTHLARAALVAAEEAHVAAHGRAQHARRD